MNRGTIGFAVAFGFLTICGIGLIYAAQQSEPPFVSSNAALPPPLPLSVKLAGALVTPAPKVLSSPYVMVEVPGGHGSGFHIGGGFYVTAAHVPDKAKTVTLKRDDNAVMEGEVVWTSADYDIALIRAGKPDWTAPIPLDCSAPVVGQLVVAHGNPLDMGPAFTEGHIIGPARSVAHWKVAVPVDMTIIPGQSGGAVVDEAGKVVGIAVGSNALFQGAWSDRSGSTGLWTARPRLEDHSGVG